ncbi:hypothetical protein FOZ62_003258, partial [Perkinsus olseni]
VTTTAVASEYREVLARAQRSTHFTMSTEDEAKRFNSNSWASSSQLAHSDPKVSYVRPTPPYKNASKVNVTTATGSRAYESEMMGRYRDNFVLPPARCPQPPVQVDLGGCCDLTLAERYQSQAMRDNSTGLQSTRRSVVDVDASGRASFGEESFRWVIDQSVELWHQRDSPAAGRRHHHERSANESTISTFRSSKKRPRGLPGPIIRLLS